MLNTADILSIFLWISGAAVAAIVGLFVARAVRNWSRSQEAADPFTIQDLREMRERGEISQAEFESMRGAILGRYADNEATETAEAADESTPPPPAE